MIRRAVRKTIPQFRPVFDSSDSKAVAKAVESGWGSEGPLTKQFEEKIAAIMGYKYGVATCNGTVALSLALMATDVHLGEEVVVPDLTFIATANAAKMIGAKPVFADIRKDDFCLDWKEAAYKKTRFTKALIPVHLNGRDAGVITSDNLVADAAQTLGSNVRKTPVAVMSFATPKIITTGYGGMALTDSSEMAGRVRRLQDHGRLDKADHHPSVGFNFRMTDIQAALGLSQLDKLQKRIDHKKMICAQYQEELEGLPLKVGTAEKGELLLNQDVFLEHRDMVAAMLSKMGVGTRPFYKPLHTQPAYKTDESFPVAESVSSMGLWLPSGPDLTEEEVSFVCEKIKESLR